MLRSSNLTTNGEHPLCGVALKLAVTCALEMNTVASNASDKQDFNKVPGFMDVGFCFYKLGGHTPGKPVYNSKNLKKLWRQPAKNCFCQKARNEEKSYKRRICSALRSVVLPQGANSITGNDFFTNFHGLLMNL